MTPLQWSERGLIKTVLRHGRENEEVDTSDTDEVRIYRLGT